MSLNLAQPGAIHEPSPGRERLGDSTGVGVDPVGWTVAAARSERARVSDDGKMSCQEPIALAGTSAGSSFWGSSLASGRCWMADSTGHRNTFAESLSGRLEAERLARPPVQLSGNRVELVL